MKNGHESARQGVDMILSCFGTELICTKREWESRFCLKNTKNLPVPLVIYPYQVFVPFIASGVVFEHPAICVVTVVQSNTCMSYSLIRTFVADKLKTQYYKGNGHHDCGTHRKVLLPKIHNPINFNYI